MNVAIRVVLVLCGLRVARGRGAKYVLHYPLSSATPLATHLQVCKCALYVRTTLQYYCKTCVRLCYACAYVWCMCVWVYCCGCVAVLCVVFGLGRLC